MNPPNDYYHGKYLRGGEVYPMPPGPLGHIDDYPIAPAIGYCPKCGANARGTTGVRGTFDCPRCFAAWYDDRIGEQARSFDDFFSG